MDDIALSVLTTVIGHQTEKGWAIVDAGWMALSRDRGTQKQGRDFGYGQVCTLDGTPLEGYTVCDANQEHGIVARVDGPLPDADIATRFPICSRLPSRRSTGAVRRRPPTWVPLATRIAMSWGATPHTMRI